MYSFSQRWAEFPALGDDEDPKGILPPPEMRYASSF